LSATDTKDIRYFRIDVVETMNSRDKGARGERELANKLKEYGFDCRRGQQYCGANGDADVVGLDGVHIEVKRTERLSLYDALAQAKHDAREGEMPVVMHRKNNCEWVAIQPLADWIELYKEGIK
jgi:Holliday junction resolvase